MSTTTDVNYNEKGGRFSVVVDGNEEAKMTFVFSAPDTFIIDHTEVNEAFNGKGFGKMMFEKAVAFARERDFKVIALCTFVKHMFDKMPDTKNILK